MSRSISMPVTQDPDGSKLLTSQRIAPLLAAAVEHEGGRLRSWEMQHVDAQPHRSTTATYSAVVEWPYGTREELLGVSARRSGPAGRDGKARIFADGKRSVAVWLYPKDPDLPGLARAAYPEQMAAILTEHRVLGGPVHPDQLQMRMIGYRPRRRAVLRATVTQAGRRTTFYIKVLREHLFPVVLQRHQLLLEAGVPAPPVVATTPDYLLVLAELPGRPLARAVFDPEPPCTAEQLISVLDAMPMTIAQLNRRPPWSDAVDHYTTMVLQAMPSLEKRLRWMSAQIRQGLAGIPLGNEPTHGDYHEGQIHVANGGIVGLLDVDTAGPGRRADDLACLVAHLSTIQRMNAAQAARVQDLLAKWVPVFDTRVDPTELRLRAAAVIISLATGPYRGQEPNWEQETLYIVDAAEALIRQVR